MDPFGLSPNCPPNCGGKGALLGATIGAVAGGAVGGAGGAAGGTLVVPGIGTLGGGTAGAVAGAAKGAVLGGAIGGAIDVTVTFLKGESAEIGAAIEAVLGKAENTTENRREVGDYCEACKRGGKRGNKNEKGDFTFKELKERVREFFGVD